MRTLALVLVAWCAVVSSCGGDPAPSPSFSDNGLGGAGGSAGSASGYCTNYCNYVTTNGVGCADYNQGNRCLLNCATYATGPCPAEWQKYVNCAMKTSMQCVPTDAGKLSLETQGCSTEFAAFLTCLGQHDAGLCP